MVREKVKKAAPWYIYDFQDLISELEQAPVQQLEPKDVFTATDETTDDLGASPMHLEEVGVKAS